MSNAHNITTAVGRFVSGSIFLGSDKEGITGRPRLDRKGQPRTIYYLGIALPKRDPETAKVLATIREAAADFRNGEPMRQDFAWKYLDGDSTVPNQRGRKPCDQEGFSEHYVLKFSSGFAPRVYDTGNREILDPRAVKLGDYIRIAGTVRANDDAQRPGVYLSHQLVQFVRAGEAIHTGLDPETAFGAPSAAAAAAPGVPSPGVTTPPPRPAEGFGMAPPPPRPAPARVMSPGCPYTYEQLRAQGWSDEQMIAAGHLVAPGSDFIPF